MRTTPFPDVVHETPAVGVYPGPTPPEGEESVGGDVVTLSPHTKVTHVVGELGLDLTDALAAPTGESSVISKRFTLLLWFHLVLISSSFPPSRRPVPLQTHHWPLHTDVCGGSAGLSGYRR